jgi:GAF domain-containing protein/HAMP domain-containing protein
MGLWKSFRNLGLGLKLTIVVISGMVALLSASVAIGFISAENMTTQAGRGRAGQEAEVIQGRFREFRQDVLASTELLLSRVSLDRSLASGASAYSLRSMLVVSVAPLDLDNVAIVGPDGVHIAGVERRAGDVALTPQQGDLIASALNGTKASGVVVDREHGSLWLAAGIPLRGPTGDIVGALLGARKVNDQLLKEIDFDREDVHLALVSGGQILAQDFPSPEMLGELSDALTEEPQYKSREAGGTVVATGLLRGSEGVPYALAHSPFAEADASIAIVVDMGELNTFEGRLTGTTAIVLASLTMVVALTVALFARGSITYPISRLKTAAERMASGYYQQVAEVRTMDEVGQLASAFNTMTAQLRQTMESLERRTDDLQRRSAQLQASSAVSHAVTSVLEVEQLIRGVVDLIRDRFGLYYVGLFLLDEAGEWAVLRAGTGEAGQAMLARGHRIRVGEGMVGWSIVNAQARVAEEVGADAVRLATEELPNTRSEAALALRSRGQVIGAMTVQSDQPGAFDNETITLLQAMADQVAVAIDNARLFVESQAALEAERRAYGELSHAAWAEYLRERPGMGYYCDSNVVTPISGRGQVRDGEDLPGFSTPLVSRGQVIGAISARKPDGTSEWTEEEAQLLRALADQLGQTLEGARLYQDTQRRAAREQLTGEIVDRMRRAVDVETLMQTTIQEMASVLGASAAFVQLGVGAERTGDEGGDGRTKNRAEQAG